MEEYKKRMKTIENSFEIIKQNTGIEDFAIIAKNFIESEEKSVALYN